MLILIISILAVSLGIALFLINKGQEKSEATADVVVTTVHSNHLETQIEQPQIDLPEENTDHSKPHSDINFLESNFEIEELYKEEVKEEAKKVQEVEEKPREIQELAEKKKPVEKKYQKKTKEVKKDQKIKGAKRGRKPKPKDDMLLHS